MPNKPSIRVSDRSDGIHSGIVLSVRNIPENDQKNMPWFTKQSKQKKTIKFILTYTCVHVWERERERDAGL